MEKNKKKWINNVSQQTLDKFKTTFIKECIERGSYELQLKYDELAELTGLSKGAVFKAVEELSAQGFIERKQAPSRRIPNTYILKGPINMEIPKITEKVSFPSGNELVETIIKMKAKMEFLERENERLRVMLHENLGSQVDIILESELPGSLTQIIYRINNQEVSKDA